MPTITLVDDDHNILTSVSIALEAEGYRIRTYTDGVSALDGFKTTPPDLAILNSAGRVRGDSEEHGLVSADDDDRHRGGIGDPHHLAPGVAAPAA